MIEEIHFFLHVVNGIYITIYNVIWYNYTYSNTNTSIINRMLVQILFSKILPSNSIFQDLFCSSKGR